MERPSASPPQEAAQLLGDTPQTVQSLVPGRRLTVGAALLLLAAVATAGVATSLVSRGSSVGPAASSSFAETLLASAAGRNESFQRFVGLVEARRQTLGTELLPAASSLDARELGEPVAAKGKVDQAKLSESQCVVDVVNIVTILGMGIEFFWQATDSTFLRCPDSTKQGCAVAVSYIVTCFSWVAESLSSAVSSCARKTNQQAACAADVTGMVATLAGFAASGASVGSSCGLATMSKVDKLGAVMRLRRQGAVGKVVKAARNIDTVSKLMSDHQQQTELNWAYAQCSFDVSLAASMLMQAGVRIAAATEDCADPTFCTVDMLTIVGVLSWAANSLALAVSDCHIDGNVKALCAADISNFIANSGLFTALAMSSSADCAARKAAPETDAAAA